MTDFKVRLTNFGLAALVDENNVGTSALKITTLEIGSGFYNPLGNETELLQPIKTLTAFGGVSADNNIIHISIRDESSDDYAVGEIGLRTGAGVLLGVVSNAEGIITTKGANDVLLIAADLAITDADISDITFGEANFIYQPGTEDSEGIFELATDAEVDAATENKVIDAAKFQSGMTRRSSSDTNLDDENKLATSAAIYALSQLITANNSAIKSINTLLQSDNADLDKLQEIVDFIEKIKDTQDTLAISNIAFLQSSLDSKANANNLLTPVPVGALFTDTDTNTHRGISDSTNSSSTTVSASSKAVKAVNDRIGTTVPAGALFTDTDTNTHRGISDSTNSSSTTVSASSKAVKAAMDKAKEATPLVRNPSGIQGTIQGRDLSVTLAEGFYTISVNIDGQYCTSLLFAQGSGTSKSVVQDKGWLTYNAGTLNYTGRGDSSWALARIIKIT